MSKARPGFCSPPSSEMLHVSHKHPHGELGSFVPGLMLGVRKCRDDHHSPSEQGLTYWDVCSPHLLPGTQPFVMFPMNKPLVFGKKGRSPYWGLSK